MRKFVVSLAIVAGVAIGGYYGYNAIQTQRGEQALRATHLDFQPLPQALASAAQQQRPVLVDFSAIWCPVCRRMHQELFADAAVKAAITQGYVLSRVDFDAAEAPAFMQKYAVTGFPTLLVLDADGTLLRRIPVIFDKPAFIAELASS